MDSNRTDQYVRIEALCDPFAAVWQDLAGLAANPKAVG